MLSSSFYAWNEKAYELSHCLFDVFGGVGGDEGPGFAGLAEDADEAGDDEVEFPGELRSRLIG